MLRSILALAAIVATGSAAGCAPQQTDKLGFDAPLRELPPLPDKLGVAGAFAGFCGGTEADRSNGVLLVAGGANFPGRMPWEGGAKVWADAVYALRRRGDWALLGRLPRPLAYGVSVTQGGGVVCVGGSDAAHHYSDAFRLTSVGSGLAVTPLPPPPEPLANACGALVGGRTLYVAGGTPSPDATAALDHVWSIDLEAAEPKWQSIPPIPGGGRMLAVAADMGDAFVVAGGASLEPPDKPDGKPVRRYLRDVYCYDPARGWRRLADLPTSLAAAPSPAPSCEEAIYILGGDDGSQVSAAPTKHRGFSRTVLRYDPRGDRWSEADTLANPRVTAPCVKMYDAKWTSRSGGLNWLMAFIVPSGEVTPGVRSPLVWYWGARVAWDQ